MEKIISFHFQIAKLSLNNSHEVISVAVTIPPEADLLEFLNKQNRDLFRPDNYQVGGHSIKCKCVVGLHKY